MLLRVLAVLALVSAPAHAQLKPDELFKAATDMYRKDFVDYQRWKSTDRHYRIRTENELRLTLENRWHWDHLAKRLRWFRRQDWPQEFKTMFVRAVQWHRGVRRLPGRLWDRHPGRLQHDR